MPSDEIERDGYPDNYGCPMMYSMAVGDIVELEDGTKGEVEFVRQDPEDPEMWELILKDQPIRYFDGNGDTVGLMQPNILSLTIRSV